VELIQVDHAKMLPLIHDFFKSDDPNAPDGGGSQLALVASCSGARRALHAA
jgi:hypothetical protein